MSVIKLNKAKAFKESPLTRTRSSCAGPFLSVLPSATAGSSGSSPSPPRAPARHRAAPPRLS